MSFGVLIGTMDSPVSLLTEIGKCCLDRGDRASFGPNIQVFC